MGEERKIVNAPGGPRYSDSVHRVGQDEAVRMTASGQQIVERPGKLANAGETGEDYVLTPGGYRPRALVHRLAPGTVVDAAAGRLRLIDGSGNVVGDFGALPKSERGEPLMPAGVSHAPPGGPQAEPGPPPLGSGWITYATWVGSDPATPISFFWTEWQVPPAPSKDDGQLIFIFNGLQSPGWIYQPVLQWGESAAGGGNYWSIASWYVSFGPAFHTDLVRVEPGDTLKGVMALTGQGDSTVAVEQNVDDVATSSRPALAGYDALYMAWKGTGDDQRIWWSTFDGSNWASQQNVDGVGTSAGPALAVFNDLLYMAWKGAHDDQRIWWSTFDGSNWAPQQNVAGVGTSAGPALAVSNGSLYMAWKGAHDDQRIWWSTFDGSNWAPQQNVDGVGTSAGPALAPYGPLYMAWKGVGDDQRIWWSTFDGSNWAPQQDVDVASSAGPVDGPDPDTSAGPALAPYGPMYLAWKASTGGENIWWTTITTGPSADYNCEFFGVAGTSLAITNQAPLTGPVETLECYQMISCSDYPAAQSVKMGAIIIEPVASPRPPVVWVVNDAVTDCGQHAIVVDGASAGGEVDLYFSSP